MRFNVKTIVFVYSYFLLIFLSDPPVTYNSISAFLLLLFLYLPSLSPGNFSHSHFPTSYFPTEYTPPNFSTNIFSPKISHWKFPPILPQPGHPDYPGHPGPSGPIGHPGQWPVVIPAHKRVRHAKCTWSS